MLSNYFLLSTLGIFIGANGATRFRPIDGRIVGGEPADIKDFPYQVSVIYIDTHNCGGTIITDRFILTAAHCTDNVPANELEVRAGSSIVNEGGQVRQVVQIYQHSNFDIDTYDYDIAILKLASALSLGVGVAPVRLPAQDSPVTGGVLAVATGWGRLSQNGPLPHELQQVSIPTLDFEICEVVYGDQMTERMICAGYPQGGKDTCQGDSGGPFVYDGTLIGITSWGDGCGAGNSPGAYTKVSYFRDYIDNIINS